MKKTLLSIFGALAASSAIGQASASWATTQNANWPIVSAGIRHFSAVDANVVWAHGYDGTAASRNYCWYTRSINGGTSYNEGPIFTGTNTVNGDTSTYQIANLEGVDANTCWVASFLKVGQNKGAIHRTSNGGASWQNMTPSGMFTDASSFADLVTFLTPQIGVVVGDPNATTGNDFEIWRTTNGGISWTLVPGANIPNPATSGEFGLTDVYTKLGSSNIWFGTNEGRIYRSTDAGQTWNVATLDPTSVGVNEIAFTSPNNGYAWLFDASSTLQTYTTTNGGASWTIVPALDPNLGQNNMGAIPGTAYYASAGAGTSNQIISYSTDGGNTFIDWGSVGIQYLTVDFVNGTTGWAGGFSDPTTVGVGGIYKYSGAAITSTVAPVAAFSLPPTLCISGPTSTTTANNTSSGSPAPSFTWSASPVTVLFSSTSATNPTLTFPGAGTYTITLIAANTLGTNTASQVVVVQACTSPVATFTSNSTACVKVSYTVNNTSTGTPTPGYSWTTTPTSGVIISNPSASTPSFTFNTAGTYSIGLTATNVSGSNTAVQVVTVSACPPNINFSIPAAGCIGASNTTTNTTTSTITPISYLWSITPGTASFSNPTATVPSFTANAAGIYTVTLKASNISGTITATQTISILCVGINENAKVLGAISIFPNPSNGVFSINNPLSGDNVNYVVTNILGTTVSNGKFNSTKNVDLSTQSKGIYFITFESNGSKISKKIIIE